MERWEAINKYTGVSYGLFTDDYKNAIESDPATKGRHVWKEVLPANPQKPETLKAFQKEGEIKKGTSYKQGESE